MTGASSPGTAPLQKSPQGYSTPGPPCLPKSAKHLLALRPPCCCCRSLKGTPACTSPGRFFHHSDLLKNLHVLCCLLIYFVLELHREKERQRGTDPPAGSLRGWARSQELCCFSHGQGRGASSRTSFCDFPRSSAGSWAGNGAAAHKVLPRWEGGAQHCPLLTSSQRSPPRN